MENLWHPLMSLSPPTLGWLLMTFLAACVVLFVRLEALGRRLRTQTASHGHFVARDVTDRGRMPGHH